MAQKGKSAALVFCRLILAGTLACSLALASKLPFHSFKHEDDPGKVGRRALVAKTLISAKIEAEMGKKLAAQFDKSVRLEADPVVLRFVNEAAKHVAAHSDWAGQASVKVIKASDIRSCSLPGGYIYLTSGLLAAAENEDEIAAVVAYQIAHAAARHWASLGTDMMILNAATRLEPVPSDDSPGRNPLTSPVVPWACGGSGFRFALHQDDPVGRWSLIIPLVFLESLRDDELEADYLALQYMYEAGYDPNVYVQFLQDFTPAQAAPSNAPEDLGAFPPTSERVASAHDEIRKIFPKASSQPKAGADFMLMKSHL